MDRPGYRAPPGGRSRRQQPPPPPAGQIVDTSSPEQEFRPVPQPIGPVHDSLSPQTGSSFLQQPAAFAQHGAGESQLPYFGQPPPHFLAQIQAPDSPLSRILTHPNIAFHRDSVWHYLRMTPALWIELFKPEVYSPAHHLLTQGLLLKYGRLPDDLWHLVNELREQPDFAQSQSHCLNAVLSTAPQQSQPPTPSVFTEREMRLLGNPGYFGQSHDGSPLLGHMGGPPADGSQTGATTPLSVGVPSRSRTQSPYSRTKGRAPKGERYKCPYTNCRHEPFRNAGNFKNHMRSCHFESEYRNRHPSEFLLPDTSPAPSTQGDGPSSGATNASDSPRAYRRMSSQEYSGGGFGASVGRDRIGSTTGHDESVTRVITGSSSRQDVQEGSSGKRRTTRSSPDEFALNLTGPPPPPNDESDDSDSDTSPTQEGPVGFAEFQMMERRRRGKQRK